MSAMVARIGGVVGGLEERGGNEEKREEKRRRKVVEMFRKAFIGARMEACGQSVCSWH